MTNAKIPLCLVLSLVPFIDIDIDIEDLFSVEYTYYVT